MKMSTGNDRMPINILHMLTQQFEHMIPKMSKSSMFGYFGLTMKREVLPNHVRSAKRQTVVV